jgi:isopenicillin N synthase-like dioxygenase
MASIGPAQMQAHAQREQEMIPAHALVPLRVIDLPRVIPCHHFCISDQGWTTVTFDMPTDHLYISSKALLQASRAFFELSTDYKQTFQTQHGSMEGWNCIKGEKEFITLRSLNCTPRILKDAASAYWAEAGGFLNELLGRIAESLDLPSSAMTVYSKPCIELGSEECATLLRIFRYEGSQEDQSKIVAEGTFERRLNFASFPMTSVNDSRMGYSTQRLGLA